MRTVIQRVKFCNIYIESKLYSSIGKGLICYIAVSKNDTMNDIKWIINKIIGLRIIEDEKGKMNLSISDVNSELMLVSQFTLYGDARKGKRPSYSNAACIKSGKKLFEEAVDYAKLIYDKDKVKSGLFQAMMDIEYINTGPVTILLDSEKKF